MYNYSINGGASWQDSATFTGLGAGSYAIMARDAQNKSNTASSSATISQPGLKGTYSANKIPSKATTVSAIVIAPPTAPRGYRLLSVQYSTGNAAVATVDNNGNLTFLKGGKVKLTVTVVLQKIGKSSTKTVKYTRIVTVNQPVTSITLNQTTATIQVRKTVKFTASITPSSATNKGVVWKSSNTRIATVSSSGVVTGKAKGTATITCMARDGSKAFATGTITVN